MPAHSSRQLNVKQALDLTARSKHYGRVMVRAHGVVVGGLLLLAVVTLAGVLWILLHPQPSTPSTELAAFPAASVSPASPTTRPPGQVLATADPNYHMPVGSATPAQAPACVAFNGNPWGYNYCPPGSTITTPPQDFCKFFACTSEFDQGTGYVIQCQDGLLSRTGSTKGPCTGHRGALRILYKHP